MKEHSEEFRKNLIKMGRQIDCIVTYGSTTLHDEIYSISILYNGALLKSVMKELDIESSVNIPKGTILNFEMGIKGGVSRTGLDADLEYTFGDFVEVDYEYLNYGNFVVYSSEKQEDEDNYRIICYDKMLYSMKDYEDLELTYPVTIREYITAVADKLNLEFKNENEEFANYDREILNEKYLDIDGNSLGYTFRDVLDELAQVTASIICINSDDELEIRYIQEIPLENNEVPDDYIITEEQLKDVNVDFGEKYGPINSIVLCRGEADNIYLQDEDSIEANGLCEIKIKDNQIMNGNDRDEYLPDILEQLDGLEYYINDYSSIGICYLELCDQYKVQVHDNEYNCIMFNDEINIDLGIEENVNTEMPEQAETDYTKADKTDRRINQTTLIVDKQNQQIQTMITQIGDREGKTTSITQDIDHIESLVEDTLDLTDEINGENPITLENCREGNLLELRIKGNNSVFKPLVPTNSLVPSNSLMPLSSKLSVYSDELSGEIERQLGYYSLGTAWANNEPLVAVYKWSIDRYRVNYLKIDKFKKYVIKIKNNVGDYSGEFSYGTFGYDVFDRMENLEQQIVANNYGTNKSYSGGWIADNSIRKYEIDTGEDDEYIFIRFDDGIQNVEIYENYNEYDLGITTELKQSGSFYDEYVIKENKGYELRRIGEGGTIIENPEPTNVIDLQIPLIRGDNYIDIPGYSAQVYAKWVIFNELTNYFATELDLRSSIMQSSSEIKLSVMETVTDEFLEKQTIESSIDLGILEDEGYIAMKTNKLTIDSDYFDLSQDGQITARRGIIGDLILHKQESGSYLYKNFNVGGTGYQSGLYVPYSTNSLGYAFLYAGFDTSQSSINSNSTNMLITHNGVTYVRNINMNGESGYVRVNFDSGRTAMRLTSTQLDFRIDNDDNSLFARFERQTGGFYLFLQNAPLFYIWDNLHGRLSYGVDLNNGGRQQHYFRGQMWKNYADNGQDYYAIVDTSGSASDRRLKHNIKDSNTSALDIIDRIRFRQFDWNEDTPYANVHIDIGVIAQEVEEIDENYVEKNERVVDDKVEEMLTMNELNLITTAMKAIQELNEIIIKQQKEIDDLKNRIDDLERGEK